MTRLLGRIAEKASTQANHQHEPDRVEKHFKSLALSGSWDELYDSPETAANISFRVRLSRALELVPSKVTRVLDLGCGPAPLAPFILRRGTGYVGVDIVQPMLLRARLREPRGQLVRAGIALPFRDASFDAVVALGFVEYLGDIPGALREMRRVLRRGGSVVVSTPKRLQLDQIMVNLTSPLRRAAATVWGRRSDSIQRTLLTPAELDRLAEQAGLRTEGGTHYHFTPLPYPFTVVLPGLSLKATRALEGWSKRRACAFLAHGYIGCYQRD